jgi:hypothetical protein
MSDHRDWHRIKCRILLDAESVGAALKELITARSQHHGKSGIRWLSREAGIPSIGYLSSVVSMKRKLHPKYLFSICMAFDMDHDQLNVMAALFLFDHAKDARSEAILGFAGPYLDHCRTRLSI